MKCKVCDAYNKPEYKKCIRCGTSLETGDNANRQKKIIMEHKSPLKNTPTFREAIIIEEKKDDNVQKDIKPGTHKVSPEEIDLWHGKKKKHNPFRDGRKRVQVLSLKDESQNDEEKDESEDKKPEHTRRMKKVAKGTNLDKLSSIHEGQEVDIIVPPEELKKKKKVKKAKNSNLKWGRIVLVSSVAGVLIIGMIVGFVYLFRGVFTGMSQIFPGHDDVPNGGVPLVERTLINGQTWHKITFYGEDGERILIEDPIRSLSIQNREAVLLLDDSSFIPEEDITIEEELALIEEADENADNSVSDDLTNNAFVEIALQASIFSEDGEETSLYVEPYKILVPESPLKIVYPTEPDIKVDYTQVFVKIKVTPGSRVIIDNINLTDRVDSDGYVQKYVNLKEGANEIEVEVETTKHRRATETIYVTRPELDVSIELNAPDSDHSEDEIWIYGTVEPDAKIYVDTSRLSANVSYGDTKEYELEDGTIELRTEFEFRYVLSSFGWNEIELVATSPDGRTATLIHRVQRTPDHRAYTKLAWPITTDADYDYLSESTSALLGQIYVCKGEVMAREDTDTSRMYLYNVGTSQDVKYVMIEYSGTQEFEVGSYYAIYADVTGTYNNYPLLKGRFIYDWEGPADATAEPDETTEP